MTFAIYVAALAVWFVLAAQRRRISRELSFELERAGLSDHRGKGGDQTPAVTWTNITLGILLTVSGCGFYWIGGRVPVRPISIQAGQPDYGVYILEAFMVGGGLALIILGVRALKRIKKTSDRQ